MTEGFKFSFNMGAEDQDDIGQTETLKEVAQAGVSCPQCGSRNLGLQDETILYCKQCHIEVHDHALNA